ncbi:hypothetical protein PGH12_09610 [Chryseobacterium wangxinyae]|uniref:FEKKY domain-containing protein n=2 Tax=unclassified Chryseobacterium TaxID=2593645 RepID=UPI00226EF06D|nr:hypothetical protein [Chryseobacterium sp. CY350]MCY0978881.1 hypothetical protein [Chryseobacterium sp. CY350]WBZ93742.1 hypothetical protein PGH12_09610 [Chryseobacterium sp. CY350]
MNKLKSFSALLLLTFSALTFAQKQSKENSFHTKSKAENSKKVLPNESLPHFMQFGIMSRNHEEFTKKYGIYVIYQNCVISQFQSKKAKENNQFVAKSLTEKYGNGWEKDLGFIPYGL